MRPFRMILMLTGALLAASTVEAAPRAHLTRSEREALVAFVRRSLSGEVATLAVAGGDAMPAPAELAKLPAALTQPLGEEVFVRIWRDRAPTIRFGAKRPNLAWAVCSAMTRGRMLPAFDFYNYTDAKNVGILIERVIDRHPVPPEKWFAELSFIDLGVHGVSLRDERITGTPPKVRNEVREGTLPPAEAPLAGLDSRNEFIGRLCKSLSLFPTPPRMRTLDTILWDKTKTQVAILGFETFLSRGPDEPIIDLYRVNDLSVSPWKDRLAEARGLGNALVRLQADDGRFFRRYDAQEGAFTWTDTNMIEHCQAILALSDLSAVTRDRRYLDAAGRGVTFLKRQLRVETPAGGETFAYVVYDDKAKLGTSAMAVVALDRYAHLADSRFHETDITRLGRFLVNQMHEDGSFRHYYRYDRKAPLLMKLSTSYPGQAAWALAVLQRRETDPARRAAWRKAALLAVDYLINLREKEMKWTEAPPDLWLAAALMELSIPVAEKPWLDYAARMADAVMKNQKRADVAPDMVGSFEDDPDGSVTGAAMKVQLLADVMQFTVPPADKREAYRETCTRALRFVRINQFGPTNAFYLSEPERVYGLVRDSAFSNDVRLETTCHVIEALLSLDRAEKLQ